MCVHVAFSMPRLHLPPQTLWSLWSPGNLKKNILPDKDPLIQPYTYTGAYAPTEGRT